MPLQALEDFLSIRALVLVAAFLGAPLLERCDHPHTRQQDSGSGFKHPGSPLQTSC
ncbi:MAG: hypothetical protein VKM92_08115 [Cyanobacteriota bacterium]|nr:hypothetical protein [Cyanobacteriota bacterium]